MAAEGRSTVNRLEILEKKNILYVCVYFYLGRYFNNNLRVPKEKKKKSNDKEGKWTYSKMSTKYWTFPRETLCPRKINKTTLKK